MRTSLGIAVYAMGVLVLACGLWVGATEFASLMPRPSRVQEIYSKDNGYFYWMTAKFTVKETGEVLAASPFVPK